MSFVSQQEEPFCSTLDATPPSPRRFFSKALTKEVLLGLPLVLGFLIWELTDENGVAICVSCARAGWRPAVVGIWLMRHDPQKRRGNVTGTFHVGLALIHWGICATSVIFAMMMLKSLWEVLGGNVNANQGRLQWQTMSLALVGFLTLFIGSLAVGTSCVNACRMKFKLWSDWELYEHCLHSRWPVQPCDFRRFYRTVSLWVMMLAGSVVTMSFLSWGAICAFTSAMICLGGARQFGQVFPYILMAGWLCSLPLSLWIALASFARSPEECWHELMDSQLAQEVEE